MKQVFLRLNLALRALLEFGIIVGFAVWGYDAGTTALTKGIMAIAAPVTAFSFWGFIDFRQAGRIAEPLRLVQELLISALAAVALYVMGYLVATWGLATISLVHHILVYALGGKLLKENSVNISQGVGVD